MTGKICGTLQKLQATDSSIQDDNYSNPRLQAFLNSFLKLKELEMQNLGKTVEEVTNDWR